MSNNVAAYVAPITIDRIRELSASQRNKIDRLYKIQDLRWKWTEYTYHFSRRGPEVPLGKSYRLDGVGPTYTQVEYEQEMARYLDQLARDFTEPIKLPDTHEVAIKTNSLDEGGS